MITDMTILNLIYIIQIKYSYVVESFLLKNTKIISRCSYLSYHFKIYTYTPKSHHPQWQSINPLIRFVTSTEEGPWEPPHSVFFTLSSLGPRPQSSPRCTLPSAPRGPVPTDDQKQQLARGQSWHRGCDYSPFHPPDTQCPPCCSHLCDGGSKPGSG